MTGPQSFYTTAQSHTRNLRWTGHIAWPLILSGAAIGFDGVMFAVLGVLGMLIKRAWDCRNKSNRIRVEAAAHAKSCRF
jgi:hypothetical protein